MTTPSPKKTKDKDEERDEEQGKVGEEAFEQQIVEQKTVEEVVKKPNDVVMTKVEKVTQEETKALDSPTFTIEDIPNELAKQEYQIDENVKKIASDAIKDALFIGSHVLIQIYD